MRPRLCAGTILLALPATAVTPAGAAETIQVTVDKVAFRPAQVSTHVGDTIEWVSADFVAHTATARNKHWDVAIPAKGSGRVTLTSRAEIDYYCRFHPNMVGHI